MTAAEPILKVEGLVTGHVANTPVVEDLTFAVSPGSITAIIGHNGAGKTSTLSAIFGHLPVWKGTVTFDGVDVTSAPTDQKVRSGFALVPEQNFVFRDLSVAENLELGGFTLTRDQLQRELPSVFEQFPVLANRSAQHAGTLSGGEQRMLSLGMALMTRPRLLLLDEPSLGLSPVLVRQFMDTVERIAVERNLAVVLVEQNVDQALRIASDVIVMRAGRLLLEDSSANVRARDDLWTLF
jgi:branched-chain amino acid transport system ATP-binding protein